jgi:hypothetical protein
MYSVIRYSEIAGPLLTVNPFTILCFYGLILKWITMKAWRLTEWSVRVNACRMEKMVIGIDYSDNLNIVEHGFPLYTDISVMSTTHAYSVITCGGLGYCNEQTSGCRWFILLWSVLLRWRTVHIVLRRVCMQVLGFLCNSIYVIGHYLTYMHICLAQKYKTRSNNAGFTSSKLLYKTTIERENYWGHKQNTILIQTLFENLTLALMIYTNHLWNNDNYTPQAVTLRILHFATQCIWVFSMSIIINVQTRPAAHTASYLMGGGVMSWS